jgi:hypothetical protein
MAPERPACCFTSPIAFWMSAIDGGPLSWDLSSLRLGISPR